MKKQFKSATQELEQTFKEVVDHMSKGLMAFPWEDKEAYCRWSAQTFYMVQHTTRFLCLAAAKFPVEHQKFHQFCLNHLKEEAGHELLAKKDLELLGYSLDMLPPSPETEFMIQNQYYWINQTPFSHFGFFWVLEQLSVLCGSKIIDRVQKAHGKKCTAFLDLHANEDIEHVKKIHEKVTAFPEEELNALITNIRQTGWAYVEMLNTIQEPMYSVLKKVS